MKSLAETDFTIIGLGLMGASLAAALRPHCRRILGVDQDPEALQWCYAQGWIDRGHQRFEDVVPHSDVIVLATPVRTILTLLEAIPSYLMPGTLVMDLGSTKTSICEKMEHLPLGVEAIGGHPLCGREVSGARNADAGLFQGRLFVLVPTASTTSPTLDLVVQLVHSIGARPLILDAATHDRLVATSSHLPYLVACTLVATASRMSDPDSSLWQLVASGFRDTSRLAGSDVQMMLDILQTNRLNVLDSVKVFDCTMHDLIQILESEDEARLKAWLENAREERRRHLR
ncbi:MAG: prephenate dehydrogenase [Thermanaerothrix sp.]|nr:prephenate dehydrogenase [Thermanaerothrix sp.]